VARHFQEMEEDPVSMEMEEAGSQLSWRSMEVARQFQEMEMEEAVMDLEFVQSSKETASGEKIQEMEADRQIQEMEMNKALEFVPSLTKKATKMKQIKILDKEFFGAPSGKCSAEGGDLIVLERWFRELGVGWVLHVADGTPSGELEHDLDASRWIPALTEIVVYLPPDHVEVPSQPRLRGGRRACYGEQGTKYGGTIAASKIYSASHVEDAHFC